MAKVLVQMTYLQAVGGIETALYQLAKTFPHEDITFLVNSTADGADAQIKRLEKYHKVIVDRDRNGSHEANVALIYTPIMVEVPWQTIKAKKVYQFIHSDIKGLRAFPQWQNFRWQPDERVDKVISVSETARDGLKEVFGVDSEVVPNIFNQPDKRVVFIYMGRASAEKGVGKVIEMAKRFDAAGKDYVILISSQVDPYGTLWPVIQNNKRIVLVPQGPYNDIFYRCADYLIQISTSESWGYSTREALANGVAVIGSRIPEIEKVVKDGENGYLVNLDLSDLDVDKIFDKIPKVKGYSEPLSDKWQDILGGKL